MVPVIKAFIVFQRTGTGANNAHVMRVIKEEVQDVVGTLRR